MGDIVDRSIKPRGRISHARLRRQIQVPERSVLWGQRGGWFVPRLLNKVYGDGRRLFALEPLDGRPRYIVVRVDSATESLVDDVEIPGYGLRCLLDDIYEAAEDQWGYCHCEECDPDQPEDLGFPVAHWGMGSGWGGYYWPENRSRWRRQMMARRRAARP